MLARAKLPALAFWLILSACAHAPGPQERAAVTDDDPELLEAPALTLLTRFDPPHRELTLTLGPTGELPTWSCSFAPQEPRSPCRAPLGWFRGPGSYELFAEYPSGKAVVRAIFPLEVRDSSSPLTVTLFGTSDDRYRLQAAVGAGAGKVPGSFEGQLGKEEIREEVARHRPALHGCAAGALAERPDRKIRAIAWFVIGADGRLAVANLEAPAKEAPLAMCLLQKMRAFRFPAPRGGPVAVSYPFSFVAPPPR